MNSRTNPVPNSLRSDVQLNQAVMACHQASLGKRTVGSYSTGVRAWLRFTAMFGIQGQPAIYPPISEDSLVYFVVHSATYFHLKYSTIKVYLAGIRNHYILGGLPNPLVTGNGQTHLRLNHVLRGIHRLQGSSTRPRLPITFDILKGLCELLRKGVFGPYFDLMLEAAFLLAFFGFLRCSEFACTTNSFNPNLNLCVRDVKVVTRGEHIDHLSINIRTSKTDQFRRGFDLRLFPTNTSLCPVSTLYRFLTVRREMNAAQSEPLFLLPERIPLNRRVFTTSLRSLLTRLRLEPQYFAGHSFRIGAATTAASVHLPDHLIQTLGRWSSDCYRIYIRTPEKLLRYAFTALTT
ncbi:uncharacterized protein LOC102801440, partial [Saccoglossus kowalevskii]|uniref:Uncharacterized protein LOC102801440 n=1 Tax=Saccoglossus kowalevskii TaxID=10224 RepID=A0ABM0M4W7_SACKO